MVKFFTHRKRMYLKYERCRVDFKITVDHINFKTNQYFLPNSHYVIFRKENKSKQFVSRNKVPTAAELKMVHVDEKIKFRACMLQDTPHRYLEKYLPKQKRFIVRQVTETKDEELYVNCGYFELPLDIYGMKPSGQEVVVNFVDPDGKASGTVLLKVEHEPGVAMAHYLPNISKSFQQLLTPKATAKTRISGSRLDANREKLEFIKQQRMVDHWSHKYDGLSDSESEADDTLSESDASETDDNTKKNKRLPTRSFIMNRTGMPQMSSKGGSSKHHVSAMLRSHMFNFGEEEDGEETKMPNHPQENASRSDDEEDNQKVNTVSFYETVTHFEPDDTDVDAKANSLDSCSTLTESEQNHLSPRVESEGVLRKPSVQMMLPAHLNMSTEALDRDHQEGYVHSPPRSPHPPQVIGHLMPGNTHVPFAHQPSYKVRASSFLICESEDEGDNAGKVPTIDLRKEKKLEAVEEEELWEDPADFDRLEEANEEEDLVFEGGSYKPRKSLRTVPPPLISDKSQFIPARSVQRATSITSASMHTSEANLPKYEPPAAVPQPPRKSLRGVPPPVPEKESFVPARVVHRANSDKSVQQEHSNAFSAAPSAYVSPPPANPPLKSYQSEYQVRQPMQGNQLRTPSPAVRHLVPVRLSAQESASLVSQSMSPTGSAPMAREHVHTHHRAASTGDMYAGIGHRHLEDAHTHNVSVKELRRNFERPPLVKENSNGSGEKLYSPLSPKNLPAGDPNIRFQRGNSEHSFSSLSTHTELDRQKHHQQHHQQPQHQHVRNHSNGAPAKILVPVRLQSSQEEQAYKAHMAVNSPQSVASLSHAPQHRQVSQEKSHNHSRSYREEPASHHGQVNHHQSHNNISTAHAEQHDRYQRYHAAQEPNYHHKNTSNTHQHGNMHPHVHGHSQSHHHIQHRPDTHHNDHSNNHHHAGAEAPHTLHRAHTMAPPIRLKANDLVPPVYERYVEQPHSHVHVHQDHHHSNAASHSAYNIPREGSYTARSMNSVSSPVPAVYRSVYA